MLIVPPTALDWDSDNALKLKEFLATPTGGRLLEALAFYAPQLLDGSHPNKTLVASGTLAGFQEAVSILVNLTRVDPNTPAAPMSPNYPDLDHDDSWKDVDKLSEETTS